MSVGGAGVTCPNRATAGRTTSATCAVVVERLGLDRPIVVAFSRGSSYALGYALHFPADLRGLVIGDYFARHVGLPAEIADQQLVSKVRGVPMSERMSEHAVRQVFAESHEVPLWDRLVEIQCPVLVIRGGRKSAIVGEELAAQWEASLPSVQLALLPDAGHDLWSREHRRLSVRAAALPGARQRGVNTRGNGSTVRIVELL